MAINIPIHPDIEKNLGKYRRIKALIEEDEKAYESETFCFKTPNETINAREVKKPIFAKSFRNIALDLLTAPRDAIFKETINLKFESEESPLAQWSQDVTLGGDKISLLQFCHDYCSISLRAYGMIWTIIDKPDYQASNFQDELINGKPYITNLDPANVHSFEMQNNEMVWFAYNRCYTPARLNPTDDIQPDIKQLCIWTRDEFIVTENGEIKNRFPHTFGFVPVVYQSLFLPPTENTIVGITPFFNTSNLIICANNMKSIGDMELFKFGNSILLMHESAISPMNMETDSKGVPRSKRQDTAGLNMLVWHGDKQPEHLTKDLAAVDKANMQANMYFNAAVENERTMRSVVKQGADGGDMAESGISKAFDVSPVLAGLRLTSFSLECWCKKVLNLVLKMWQFDPEKQYYTLEFPRRFDIAQIELSKRLNEIKLMQEIRYPSEEGMRIALKGLTPELTQTAEEQAEINEEIDNAPMGDQASIVDEEIKAEMMGKESKMRDMLKSKGMSEDEINKSIQFGMDSGESTDSEED